MVGVGGFRGKELRHVSLVSYGAGEEWWWHGSLAGGLGFGGAL